MKLTVTEQEEITAKKILDILGNSSIVELHYKFNENEKTRIHWLTDDNGSLFEHTLEFGWRES